jgi:hypothetical protein
MTEQDKEKTRRFHRVKLSDGHTHNFTARRVSINKLAARKVNLKRLQSDLEKESSLLDASDIPLN